MERVCQFCGNAFDAPNHLVKRGLALFCSRVCSIRSRHDSLEDRFWMYLGKKTQAGCILWAGCCNTRGYGIISGQQKVLMAHRVSFALLVGPIGELFVLHRCDNPPCINPSHLFLGTHRDNQEDKVKKGRNAHLKGVDNGCSKITEEQVKGIRRCYSEGETLQALADKNGLSKSTVHQIIKYKSWSHIQ